MSGLDGLTAADFAAACDEPFHLAAEVDGLDPLAFTLEAVEPLGDHIPEGATRRPFSLAFRGPRSPELRQGTYPLRHATLGTLDIFVVPVARDEHGVRYEAVFG